MISSTLPTPSARDILVVDDNIDAAESLSLFLNLEGHSLRCAHNGAVALDLARQRLPEVVVLDIGLPGIDGFEVARRLRELAAGAPMRIIVASGYAQVADRQAARDMGIDAYLLKPVDPNVVAREVDRFDGIARPDPLTLS